MAENLAKWPSKRGPISKIRPSDGCARDAVPLAVGQWYNFHEFGWHLGNVGIVYSHNVMPAMPLIFSLSGTMEGLSVVPRRRVRTGDVTA